MHYLAFTFIMPENECAYDGVVTLIFPNLQLKSCFTGLNEIKPISTTMPEWGESILRHISIILGIRVLSVISIAKPQWGIQCPGL